MLLHTVADRAMRQWTFKPFLGAGRPIAVQVILEVSFPEPVKEAENRILERHRDSKYACDRQLEADAAKAEEACAAAVRDTDALPPGRVLERDHAVASHAQSLMAAGRTRDAIAQFERVNEIRAARVKGPDADAADVIQILGVLHQQVGEHAKADAAFATAIAMYSAAQERLSQMSDGTRHASSWR